ncbi:MAG: amino acid permease [Calditrichia bacterium]
MAILSKAKQLKKELGLLNIYAIATGATLSSGFFLLPGLAAAQAGPAVILSYLIAAVHLIPAVFSMAELSTAMPRAGGLYYFADRSLGPYWGTISGLGTWLALTLKTAFALIGMGAYLGLFFPTLPIIPLAASLAIIFGLLNLFGAKKTGGFQVLLMIGLLLIIFWFIGGGLFSLRAEYFTQFFSKGFMGIYGTAGLVYISYVGITKIASVSEEVKNPEKNLPLGMFLALITAIIIYILGTVVMVGVIPPEKFHVDLTPVASAANILTGHWGAVLMTGAAILAFFSVANAAILSASRYPLAMGRDHLVPRFFSKLNKHQVPSNAIYITIGVILAALILFNPTKIAKLAGAFQLMLFAISCLAVIIMRESRIESYDPGFKSPLYPWMQIFGIVAPFFLIIEMGFLPIVFTVGMITIGTAWYFYYARNRVIRDGAIYHIFARLGERRFEGLDRELRGIMKEKGLREEDPFDMVIASASMIDLSHSSCFEEVVRQASARFANRLSANADALVEGFMQGTRVGATPVSKGAALPHLRFPGIEHPEMVIVRVRKGVVVDVDHELFGEHASHNPVYAFFFLISPEEDPGQHLRILAQIAGLVDDERFIKRWLAAKNELEMKEILLRHDRYIALRLKKDSKTTALIGKRIAELDLPKGSLIALIHRRDEIIIPRGHTVLKEGDRLTIIGYPEGIKQLYELYKGTVKAEN